MILGTERSHFEERLPEGFRVVNKKPILKEIRAKRENAASCVWTCWVKNPQQETFLAVMRGEQKSLKLIPENEIKMGYTLKSIKTT